MRDLTKILGTGALVIGGGLLIGVFVDRLDPYRKAIEQIRSAPTIQAHVPGNEVYIRYQREDIRHGQPTKNAFIDEIYARNPENIKQYGGQREVFDFIKQPINWPDADGDGTAEPSQN